MSLGNVLGGVAQSAIDTNSQLDQQARLDQAAADAHAMETRKEAAIAAGQTVRDQAPSDIMDLTGSTPDAAPALPDAPTPTGTVSAAAAIPVPAPPADAPVAPAGTQAIPTGPAAPPQAPSTPQAAIPTGSATAPSAPPAYARATASGPIVDEFRAQGHNGGYSPALVEAAIAGGQIESGLNPNIQNNGSSTGLMQFHPATFKEMGGKDIKDPHQQIAAGLANYAQGAKVLPSVLGREPTPTELYIYHQQGAAGGPALLSANPNDSAIDTLVKRTGMSLATAQKSIQGNWPHTKGETVPSDPTVGQFLSAYKARVGKFMTGEAADHPVGAPAPAADGDPQGTVQPLPATLPSMQRTSGVGGRPGTYPTAAACADRTTCAWRRRTIATCTWRTR